MNVSKEILNVIDGLGERFGVVIDWSKDNVYPQVADICERLIHYKLVCQWIWFAVFAVILSAGIVLIIMLIKDRRDLVGVITDKIKLIDRTGDINSRLGFYKCDYYPFLHKDEGGYSVNEINATLLGELSFVGVWSCFIVGVIGIIYNFLLLIKLYIIPELYIINYITDCIGGH